jgi:maltooligosyltrehalose trehalohydrolase
MQVGAWVDDHGAHFRLWAPAAARAELLLDGRAPVALISDGRGFFSADLEELPHGTRYRYRVDGAAPAPDPASRWQPEGVHGPSAIDDARAFAWTSEPPAVPRHRLVIYELHVGAFTPEGTFDSARERLPYLRSLGVTAIELMPIAEFAGSRNWGYDGAALFAPSSVYGGPDALRRFVDAAHAEGLAVLLDVVYNHLGPDGAYVYSVSPEFFCRDTANPWGASVNLADPAVSAWLVANAVHWAVDYRVDGFRLDATHALPESDAPAFLRALTAATRAAAGRDLVFIAEDHRNLAEMLRAQTEGGWGPDGVWADDFHHHIRVMTAGDRHGYFEDFSGEADDLADTIRHGWFFRGQYSRHLGHVRGTDPAGLSADQFVVCIQNHDQVGNRALGERLHHVIDLDAWRAASALLLLGPGTPLLFMGQEWAASTPFAYFTDHHDELGHQVREGRRNEFSSFPEFRDGRTAVPDPQAMSTFDASRLKWHEQDRQPHAGVLALYRALLALRGSERLLQPHVSAMGTDTVGICYETFGVIARLRGEGAVDLDTSFAGRWHVVLTTEDARFAPEGTPPALDGGSVVFRRPSALVLRRG